MNRRDMIAKAAAYMNKRFGPVRQSDNPEQWYARLGQLVDFIGEAFEEEQKKPDDAAPPLSLDEGDMAARLNTTPPEAP